ncbi:MAG: hypothetical protein ACR2N5_00135, partial [Solirubrobacterales bacterium]
MTRGRSRTPSIGADPRDGGAVHPGTSEPGDPRARLPWILAALALLGLAAGIGAAALLVDGTSQDTDALFVVVALIIGWGFIGAGALAWWHRPLNRVGPLMIAVGFAWFLASVQFADSGWFIVGKLFGN